MKVKAWITSLAQWVAAIIMLQTLYFKFGAHEDSVFLFTQLGQEPYGRIGVGVGELIASVLILVPRTVWLGAILAIGLMAGAIYFHATVLGINFRNDGGQLFAMACIVLACGLWILSQKYRQIPLLSR
ncbi:MAG: DoxX family protein [Microscillaceae bacterium]|nr:DoxX family protein [Microscillaceae bacterium]